MHTTTVFLLYVHYPTPLHSLSLSLSYRERSGASPAVDEATTLSTTHRLS